MKKYFSRGVYLLHLYICGTSTIATAEYQTQKMDDMLGNNYSLSEITPEIIENAISHMDMPSMPTFSKTTYLNSISDNEQLLKKDNETEESQRYATEIATFRKELEKINQEDLSNEQIESINTIIEKMRKTEDSLSHENFLSSLQKDRSNRQREQKEINQKDMLFDFKKANQQLNNRINNVLKKSQRMLEENEEIIDKGDFRKITEEMPENSENSQSYGTVNDILS